MFVEMKLNVCEEYRWSSIHAYYDDRDYPPGLTEPGLILEMMHENRTEAINRYRELGGSKKSVRLLPWSSRKERRRTSAQFNILKKAPRYENSY